MKNALPSTPTAVKLSAAPPAAPSEPARPEAARPAARSAVASPRRIPRPDRVNLFLLRHASAGVRRPNPLIDARRPVDKDGKRHALHLAVVLNALKLSFDLIVSSPLKRSLQTAQMIATETGYESGLLQSHALAPEGTVEQFQALVRECMAYENVLIVGHNPNLTSFLTSTLGTFEPGEEPAVRMRKGSIARVTIDRGPGTLQWLLDPRIVRSLYATSIKSSRRKTSRK